MLPLSPADLAPTPAYHWSPANQRGFLETLSITGNITASASSVGMSKQAAYTYGNRASGAAFRLGWDAAVLLARRRVEGELLERALDGQEEIYERDADTGRVTRTRVHNGLSMAMLARLDRMALGRGDVPAETAMARIVAQDFDAFLDLIETGGSGATAMLFVQARDGGLYSRVGGAIDAVDDEMQDFATHGQLAQISAGPEEDKQPELTPEEEAAQMTIWFCDETQGWRTNFPPPAGFYGIEEGEFGEEAYERELAEDECEAREKQAEVETAPLRAAGEAARLAWFGLEAKDITQRRGDAEEGEQGRDKTSTLCHPREDGGPWSDAVLENRVGDLPNAQVMDPRLHGDDNEGLPVEIAADPETISTEQAERLPIEDTTIRALHSSPPPNYPAMGMIPPWAERIY